MKILDKIEFLVGNINRLLLKVGSLLTILLISAMTGIILVAVFFRYFMQNAISWSEELSKFLMVWMTFMAAPIALHYGMHVGIHSLLNALKGRLYYLTILLGHLGVMVLMGICTKEGIELAWFARIQRASSMELSLIWVYLSIPLGCLMMLAISFERFIWTLKRIFHSIDENEIAETNR